MCTHFHMAVKAARTISASERTWFERVLCWIIDPIRQRRAMILKQMMMR